MCWDEKYSFLQTGKAPGSSLSAWSGRTWRSALMKVSAEPEPTFRTTAREEVGVGSVHQQRTVQGQTVEWWIQFHIMTRCVTVQNLCWSDSDEAVRAWGRAAPLMMADETMNMKQSSFPSGFSVLLTVKVVSVQLSDFWLSTFFYWKIGPNHVQILFVKQRLMTFYMFPLSHLCRNKRKANFSTDSIM